MFKLTVVVLFVSLLAQTAEAAPPKELYGKSIIVTWSESREQRPEGEQQWRTVQGSQTLSFYVSDAGRVFNKLSYSTRGGSAERKGEIAGQGGSKRSINFNGRSLLVLMPTGAGGATRVSVDFEASYTGCSAQVTRAKESAGTIVRSYSGIIKHMNEIRSYQVGGASCSIRSGNVFGN